MSSNDQEASPFIAQDEWTNCVDREEDRGDDVPVLTAKTLNVQQSSEIDQTPVSRTASISSGDSSGSHADKSLCTNSSADTLSSTSQDSMTCAVTRTTMHTHASPSRRSAAANTSVASGTTLLAAAAPVSNRSNKYQKNERAGMSSPRSFTPRRRKNNRAGIPAPLALVAAATNVALNVSTSNATPGSPTAAAAPLAGYDTPPDTPAKDAGGVGGRLKSRFKLPPPLKLAKKKHSCPHLFAGASGGAAAACNNEASAPQSPRTPVLSVSKNCEWIRNEFGSSSALNSTPTQKRRLFDDPAVVFRFDNLVTTTLSPVNKSHSYHQMLHQHGSAAAALTMPSTTAVKPTTRYMLIKQSNPVHLCKLDHPRTVVGKLTSSKLLRRWETHTLLLDGDKIKSMSPSGFMETPIPYAIIEDIHVLPHFEGNDKYCLRIFIPDGSILLQTNHVYTRHQWLSSIQWRRCMFRYRRILRSCTRPEVLLKEIKCMVEMAIESSLQDEVIFLEPVQLVCGVIKQIFERNLCRTLLDPVIICVAPLLETVATVSEICPWFNRYCRESPRSRLVDEVFANVALQTLKKNMDYGKFPSARSFVQNFLLAVIAQNNGVERVKVFIQRAHGPVSVCPHSRVLPNLISACLAAIHSIFDPTVPPSPIGLAPTVDSLSLSDLELNPIDVDTLLDDEDEAGGTPAELMDRRRLFCYCVIFEVVSEFEDWRASLSSIVQPLPFPEEAFSNDVFARAFHKVVQRIGADPRCEVHLTVLGVREGKEGFFHLYCPGGPSCVDNGELYANMLNTLLNCCCKRKRFLQSLISMLGPLQLLALRENDGAMQALCHMLEMEVVEGDDTKVQMITTLQSTSVGHRYYLSLCDRQQALRQLQQRDGPRKMTLPSKSTDGDLAVLLSSGSFGNLEWLSLAFTNVTSACAEYLIKLPSLRYLNLWSTQFGDTGAQMVAENLHKLQVLNLCETRVTDVGILNLTALKSLRKLNLNSTQLSAKTFKTLQESLPELLEVDIRYTEAWCAEDYPSAGQEASTQRPNQQRR